MLELNNFFRSPLFTTYETSGISSGDDLYRDIIKMASKISTTNASYITT